MRRFRKSFTLKVGIILLLVIGIPILLFVFVYPFYLVPNYYERKIIWSYLPKAVEKWQSLGISDYDVDVHIDETDGCQADVTLRVRNNQLQSFRQNGNEDQAENCTFGDYVIPELFNITRYVYSFKVWPFATLTVHFNTRYGYISYFKYHPPPYLGLGDHHLYLIVIYKNFKPLPPNS